MKLKSILTIVLTIFTFVLTVNAQSNTPPNSFIQGTMDINFVTKQVAANTKGVQDEYTINLNLGNSILFHGKMTDRPQIIDGWISKAVVQPRSLKYNVSCDIMNPKNTAQIKHDISELKGFVNINSAGEYDYNGGLGFSVLDRMAGSDSKFSGVAAGHPLTRPSNWLDTLQRETVNITRSVNGKVQTVSLNKYDKMEFRSLVLAAGPTATYQDATVNGEMLYDYDKNTWFFNNMNVSYPIIASDGQSMIKSDRITGTIRWLPDAKRAENGLGYYDFDVRVNEPVVSDFSAAPATDDAAFFAADNTSSPGLTGTMKYKDTFDPSTVNAAKDPTADNASVTRSAVTINLNSTSITKQQLMILNKIIIFVSVIPMNSN
jgi:hypothetical protein